jgi:hypothetical protein
MGCTTSISAFPCEYPAFGFNYRGIEENNDSLTGNFSMRTHEGCSWKWSGSEEIADSKYFYTFPILAQKVSGFNVIFSFRCSGYSATNPVTLHLELYKTESRSTVTALLATASTSDQNLNVTLKSTNPLLVQAERGDVYRLKCSNITKGSLVVISGLSSSLDPFIKNLSVVRLPFEEFLESSRELSIKSYRSWNLTPLKDPIGWTSTPCITAKPFSIMGSFELEIVPLDGGISGSGKGDRIKGDKQHAHHLPTFTDYQFDLNISLIRGMDIITSRELINASKLHPGINKIAFTITEINSSSALLKKFKIGDRYQIDRYQYCQHSELHADFIVRINKFRIKFTTNEKNTPICMTPHRLALLSEDQRSESVRGLNHINLGINNNGIGARMEASKTDEDDEYDDEAEEELRIGEYLSNKQNQQTGRKQYQQHDSGSGSGGKKGTGKHEDFHDYDSFYYVTPIESRDVIDEIEDQQQYYHSGPSLRLNRRIRSGWNSWNENDIRR